MSDFEQPDAEKSSSQDSGYKAQFSNDEWNYILYSPIVVFALVAGADGTIDRKEVVSFHKELLKGIAGDSAMMQHVMIEVIPNMESLTKDVLHGEVDPKSVIEKIAKAVDLKLSDDEAMQFKLSLLQFGKAVAESSGGFLGIFGNKISKEEKTALAALAVLLKVNKLH
ncbi:MAG: hypothetical protein ABW104_00220 [Candidatus Thiodiazotropha sp. 6PLUC2]